MRYYSRTRLNSVKVRLICHIHIRQFFIDRKQIFNVKSKKPERECEIVFWLMPVGDVINTRTNEFPVKYGGSDNWLCLICKGNTIV